MLDGDRRKHHYLSVALIGEQAIHLLQYRRRIPSLVSTGGRTRPVLIAYHEIERFMWVEFEDTVEDSRAVLPPE